MNKIIIIQLVLVVLLAWTSYAAPVTISYLVRDQAPDKMCVFPGDGNCGTANKGRGFSGTDFENELEFSEKGIVTNFLGNDNTPIFNSQKLHYTTKNEASFYKWFHNSNETVNIVANITFERIINNNAYVFISDTFYPIDGKGWNDSKMANDWKMHNFAFCLELHVNINFTGTGYIAVYGDDDIFLFINKSLVLDFGGTHSYEGDRIDLENLGFSAGIYLMDFFMCERKSRGSSLNFTTNIDMYCNHIDACGVCNGNGLSCCNLTACNDGNPCTEDLCPVYANGSCVHNPIANCPSSSFRPSTLSLSSVSALSLSSPSTSTSSTSTSTSTSTTSSTTSTSTGSSTTLSGTSTSSTTSRPCIDCDGCRNITLNNCSPNAFCSNTQDSFMCNCKPGFIGNGTYCIPSCSFNNGNCDWRVHCTENANNVSCGECPRGTFGAGNARCNSSCGDSICSGSDGEDCVTCPYDCISPCDVCGDSFCEPIGENCTTCSKDCGRCEALTCAYDCNRLGDCIAGVCYCNEPWSGPSCSTIAVKPINVNLASAKPQFAIEVLDHPSLVSSSTSSFPLSSSSSYSSPLIFDIIVQKIEEIDANNTVMRSYIMDEYNFTTKHIGEGLNKYSNFSTYLQNGAVITISTFQFEENSTIYFFANKSTNFTAPSFKMNIIVENWPFYSLSNYLLVKMTSKARDKEEKLIENKDESGNLIWMIIKVDDISLYGIYMPEAIIDGKIQKIEFQLNKANYSIIAKIPHFWKYAA